MDKSQLVAFLEAHQIPLSEWGAGKAKTVDHLLKEINSAEAFLKDEDGTLFRLISVAVLNVFCRHGTQLLRLKEEKQVFKDGRERKRDLKFSLSEKMGPDEHSLDAALRMLQEEIGVTERLQLTAKDSLVEGPEPSGSYPGLMTRYTLHAWEVFLPEHLYKPEGYVEEQADKKNYYVWVPA